MSFQLAFRFAAFCLLSFCILESEASFIKGKNVPRVGRSDETSNQFDHTMGYVIKTTQNKNIPRMGRRNYDSENRYDIPKFYQLPVENVQLYEDADSGYGQEQLATLYENQLEMENMK